MIELALRWNVYTSFMQFVEIDNGTDCSFILNYLTIDLL